MSGEERCALCGETGHDASRHYPPGIFDRLASAEQRIAELMGKERRSFIRQAAIRIYTQGMSAPPPGSTYVGNAPGVTFSPRTCWQAACALWDAQPEDC